MIYHKLGLTLSWRSLFQSQQTSVKNCQTLVNSLPKLVVLSDKIKYLRHILTGENAQRNN